MKVNDPNLSAQAQRELAQSGIKNSATDPNAKVDAHRTGAPSTDRAGGAEKTQQVGSGTPAGNTGVVDGAARDDVHLSELVRSLRSLAADSPQRAARLEQIARAYTDGNYKVDAERTAQGIIDDALRST